MLITSTDNNAKSPQTDYASVQITVDDYDNYSSKAKVRNVDLVIDLDYLGCLEIESKYLQKSVILWLIGQLKYFEINQHKYSICCEISAENNLFCGYLKNNYFTTKDDYENEENFIFKHKLTQIFKLTQLNDDKLCFAYFYHQSNTFTYKLYLFRSNKVNLVHILLQLQHKAFKLKQISNNNAVTRSFCVDYIGEVSTRTSVSSTAIRDWAVIGNGLLAVFSCMKTNITSSELNQPNLIELCLKRINESLTPLQILPTSMNNNNEQLQCHNVKRTSSLKRTILNVQQQFLNLQSSSKPHHQETLPPPPQPQQQSKKVLLNFTKKKLSLDEIRKQHVNENLNSNTIKHAIIEENYDNLIYFNNSIHNENYFCIAFNEQPQTQQQATATTTTTTDDTCNCTIKAVIFYTSNEQLHDAIIKEYIKNISKLNDDRFYLSTNTSRRSTKTSETIEVTTEEQEQQKRSCVYCPMQQYIQLCEYLNSVQSEYKIYIYLLKIFDKTLQLADQTLISEFLQEQNININSYNIYSDRNRLLMGLLHKLCTLKQLEHVHTSSSDRNSLESFNLFHSYNYVSVGGDGNEDDGAETSDSNDDITHLNDLFLLELAQKHEKFSLDNIYNTHSTKTKSHNHNRRTRNYSHHRHQNTKTTTTTTNTLIAFTSDDDDNSCSSYLVDFSSNLNNSTITNTNTNSSLLSLELSKTLSTLNNNNNNNNSSIACLSPPIRQHQQHKQQTQHNLLTTSTSASSISSLNSLQSSTQPPSGKRRESMRRSIFNKVVGGPESDVSVVDELQPPQFNSQQRRRSSLNTILQDFTAKTTVDSDIAISVTDEDTVSVVSGGQFVFKRFKTSHDIRQFWKKIISEQIILIKMDHENRKLKMKAKQVQVPQRRKRANMAFNYSEVENSKKGVDKMWDNYLNEEKPVDFDTLRKSVLDGVTQSQRDTIWLWLAKQYNLRNKQNIEKLRKNCVGLREDMDYNSLLKESTTHQHAIMLDLARTFPGHPNFSQQFGLGQLALFNILKAYSVYDPEVGYCQGLSFIVGILLIHVDNDEEKAFELLKQLLINMGLRKQFKPDMFALQKYMYQMTRLLYDHQNDIYTHLEDNETSATLYCAPWFLTLFASQFEIGFVARVFDFLFTEGPIALFKIALSIMGVHKALLLHCESFEVIVNYLKITVPEMSLIQSELIINKAFEYDIKHDLEAYEIEFYIFQEEVQLCSQQSDVKSVQLPSSVTLSPLRESSSANNKQNSNNQATLQQLEQINSKLKERIEDLLEQIQLHQVNKHTQDDLIYKLQHDNTQLKCKIETLEIERIGLLNQLKKNFD